MRIELCEFSLVPQAYHRASHFRRYQTIKGERIPLLEICASGICWLGVAIVVVR